MSTQRNKICHVIYRLDYGGLENGLVNLINGLSHERWDHVIVTLDGFSDYRKRLPDDVQVLNMDKKPGLDLGLYYRLWRVFRALKPQVMHTRNLATLEAQLPAFVAGIKCRVHGEHGRDVHDLDNKSRKYRTLRRLFGLIVQQYTTVSKELKAYLTDEVHIRASRVQRICNGVDTRKFSPASSNQVSVTAEIPFDCENRIVFGTIGRMQAVKDQLTFCKAFVKLVQSDPQGKQKYGLIMIGDGPLRNEVKTILEQEGLSEISWLPGTRDDTPELLRSFDVFVLPSLAEGISNTLLEALAVGLPVIATNVGGNPELVTHGQNGLLVERAEPEAMASAMSKLAEHDELRQSFSKTARERVCKTYSLDAMIAEYDQMYTNLVAA